MFSDIVMPGGMNGIALAQEIGTRYPEIPVLLTSGYSDVRAGRRNRFADPAQAVSDTRRKCREALQRSRLRGGAQAAQ